MKINAQEYSEEAFSSGLSLGTAAWYLLQLFGVGFAGVKAAQWLNAKDGQIIAVAGFTVVCYFAYVIAKMASSEVALAKAEADEATAIAQSMQANAEKAERYAVALQALNEKAQALYAQTQSLKAEKQRLGDDLGAALLRSSEFERSLNEHKASAPKHLETAIATAKEEVQKQYEALLLQANTAKNSAISSAKQWQAKYEQLRGEVEEQLLKAEMQRLEASIRNRENAMRGRTDWPADLLAKHDADKKRLEELQLQTATAA